MDDDGGGGGIGVCIGQRTTKRNWFPPSVLKVSGHWKHERSLSSEPQHRPHNNEKQ